MSRPSGFSLQPAALLRAFPTPFWLVLTAAIWGSSFVATQVALEQLSVLNLTFARIVLASALFGFILAFSSPKTRRINRRADILRFTLLGLMSVSFYQLLQIAGNRLTNASVTSLLICLHPITLALCGMLFLREPLSRLKIFGIALGFFGGILVVTQGTLDFHANLNYLLGGLYLLANSVCWALYSVLAKRTTSRYSAFTITAYMTIFGTLGLLPLVDLPAFWAEMATLTARTWMALIYLFTVCSVFAYVLWLYCLGRVEASTAGVYLYLEPLVTWVLAPLFVGNQFTLYLLFGAFLIIPGVYITTIVGRRRQSA